MMFFFSGEEGEERGREGDCSWFENNCVYFSLYIYIEKKRNYRLTIGRISMEEERLRIE